MSTATPTRKRKSARKTTPKKSKRWVLDVLPNDQWVAIDADHFDEWIEWNCHSPTFSCLPTYVREIPDPTTSGKDMGFGTLYVHGKEVS